MKGEGSYAAKRLRSVRIKLALAVFVLVVMWWRSRSTGVPPGGAE